MTSLCAWMFSLFGLTKRSTTSIFLAGQLDALFRFDHFYNYYPPIRRVVTKATDDLQRPKASEQEAFVEKRTGETDSEFVSQLLLQGFPKTQIRSFLVFWFWIHHTSFLIIIPFVFSFQRIPSWMQIYSQLPCLIDSSSHLPALLWSLLKVDIESFMLTTSSLPWDQIQFRKRSEIKGINEARITYRCVFVWVSVPLSSLSRFWW